MIQSIERTAAILEYLAKHPKGARLTDISRGLGLYKSTTFGIISTLEHLNYVEQNQETGKYTLGLKLFELGQAAYANVDLVSAARPHIEALAEQYGETVHIGVLSDLEVVYLDKVESSKAMRVITTVGGRQPAFCTALGKAMLAFLPEKEREERIDQIEFTRYTMYTICGKDQFRSELALIREQGYALDREESEIGLSCLAAPIRDESGNVTAALSLAGATVRVTQADQQSLVQDLLNTAKLISTQLGCR